MPRGIRLLITDIGQTGLEFVKFTCSFFYSPPWLDGWRRVNKECVRYNFCGQDELNKKKENE